MEDKVIITGGAFRGYLDASDKAIVYNDDGFVENLPPLRLGRWGHSCGHFITNTAEGSKVREAFIQKSVTNVTCFISNLALTFIQVVYVVTGGNGGISAYFNELKKPGDRTETYFEGSSSWTLEISRLPSEREHLKVVSMDNRVFASGTFLKTFSLAQCQFLFYHRRYACFYYI